MKKVGQFEKVSESQFKDAVADLLEEEMKLSTWQAKIKKSFLKQPKGNRNIRFDNLYVPQGEMVLTMYAMLSIPTRATTKSAGYDFKAPFSFTLESGATIKIPTGIRVKIEEGWWLACMPRSSLGFKYRAQLDNTVGVIDGDYYHSDNEGHIFLKVTNDSKDGKTMTVKQGEGIMQGIFLPYGVTHDDAVTAVRNGGFGSTNHRVSERID